MKLFFVSLILVLTLQSYIKAEDISEFEVEGMSVGESALNYFSLEQIRSARKAEYNDNTYTTLEPIDPIIKTYDEVSFSYRSDDKKYKMAAVTGIKNFYNDHLDCYQLQDKIFKEIQEIFPSAEVNEAKIIKMSGNRKGTTRQTYVELIKGDFAAIQCYKYDENFSESKPYRSFMRVNLFSKIYNQWLITKAFK